MMPFEVEGLPFEDILERFEFEGKEEEKPSKELIKYFKKWLEREWAYFNLSRHFEKAPGVTITPLSFVKGTVKREKKEEKLKIIPKRKFELKFEGSFDSLMIFHEIIMHEAEHILQPLVDQYIFNELIISMIADFLKNDRNLLGIQKYVKYLNNSKLSCSELKFLELRPCLYQISYPFFLAIDGVMSKRAAERWSRYFLNSILESEIHRSGIVKHRKLFREDKKLAEIFANLPLFKLIGIDEAEKEARRLRREGYTFDDLLEIYRGNLLKYSKRIEESLRKISDEGKKIVGKRMNLFKEMWKRLSKAENPVQFDKVWSKYIFVIIKDCDLFTNIILL